MSSPPIAQRRHDDVDHVEAVEQVFAELRPAPSCSRRLRLVAAITRTLTSPLRRVGADLLHFAGLEEAQQQPLHAQRHLADFVEEDRPVVGHLELAGLVAIGAGEAALDVAEQFRFEQRFGKAGAIDGTKGRLRARAAALNRAGDDFLADAALTGDEHFGVGPGDAIDFLLEIPPAAGCSKKLHATIKFDGLQVDVIRRGQHHQTFGSNRKLRFTFRPEFDRAGLVCRDCASRPPIGLPIPTSLKCLLINRLGF